MDIIGGIAAATEGLKLVNELRKIDNEVDKAELKLRLVEVADKLLDSKQALQEAKDLEVSLQKEISALRAQMELKDKLRSDETGRLYRVGADGKQPDGVYCSHCYTKEDKLFRLILFPNGNGNLHCTNCNFWCEGHR